MIEQFFQVLQKRTETKAVSGQGKLSAFKTVDPFHTFSVVKNPVDSKYYFAAMGRTDRNRDPYVYKYNAVTNEIEQEYRIQMGVSSWDSHRSPVINVDSTGRIYVIVEELYATGSVGTLHNSPVRIYRTSTAGTLSSFVLLHTFTGKYSYPFLQISGSNLLATFRGTVASENAGAYQYYASTDTGATWSAVRNLYNSGNVQQRAYFQRVHSHNGKTCMILNERDDTVQSFTFVAYIESANGVTWSNAAGTWSKDVVANGAITRAEMVANCMVYNSTNYATTQVCFEGAIVKSSGQIKILLSIQTKTGNTYVGNSESAYNELRFYRFNSGWSYNAVQIPAGMVGYWAYNRPFQLVNNNEPFDDIILIDDNNNRDVLLKRSYDNFATEESIILQHGQGRYMLGEGVQNAVTADDYLFVLNDPIGDIYEIENEGIEDYSDLLIVKP